MPGIRGPFSLLLALVLFFDPTSAWAFRAAGQRARMGPQAVRHLAPSPGNIEVSYSPGSLPDFRLRAVDQAAPFLKRNSRSEIATEIRDQDTLDPTSFSLNGRDRSRPSPTKRAEGKTLSTRIRTETAPWFRQHESRLENGLAVGINRLGPPEAPGKKSLGNRLRESLRRSAVPAPRDATETENVKFGIRLGVLKVAAILLSLTVLSAIGWEFHSNYESPIIPEGLWIALAAFATYTIAGPIVEEVIFRWWAYGVFRDFLRQAIPKAAAILIAGIANVALFVVLHETADIALMALRAFGVLVLLYAYEKGGLAAAIGVHVMNNLAFLLPDFLAAAFGIQANALLLIALLLLAMIAAVTAHDLLRSLLSPR